MRIYGNEVAGRLGALVKSISEYERLYDELESAGAYSIGDALWEERKQIDRDTERFLKALRESLAEGDKP